MLLKKKCIGKQSNIPMKVSCSQFSRFHSFLYFRFRGFWWSPDSKMIAFTRNDESKIPKFNIAHQGKDDPTHTESHRYPFAGKRKTNVVSLLVILIFLLFHREKKSKCSPRSCQLRKVQWNSETR
jgi:hypothetical protein